MVWTVELYVGSPEGLGLLLYIISQKNSLAELLGDNNVIQMVFLSRFVINNFLWLKPQGLENTLKMETITCFLLEKQIKVTLYYLRKICINLCSCWK